MVQFFYIQKWERLCVAYSAFVVFSAFVICCYFKHRSWGGHARQGKARQSPQWLGSATAHGVRERRSSPRRWPGDSQLKGDMKILQIKSEDTVNGESGMLLQGESDDGVWSFLVLAHPWCPVRNSAVLVRWVKTTESLALLWWETRRQTVVVNAVVTTTTRLRFDGRSTGVRLPIKGH